MKNFISKLGSRKLWTAIAGVASGLCVIFGADQGVASTISGALLSIVSVVTYIVTEGKIDAAAVADAIKKAQEAVEDIREVE